MKPLLPKLALFALMYAFILTILTLCWVGAEYVFEGAVHSSKVDSWIACLLSYYMTKELFHLDRKMGGKRGPTQPSAFSMTPPVLSFIWTSSRGYLLRISASCSS